MKTAPLTNGTEVTDIDLHDDAACEELGRLAAHECVVVVRQAVSEKRLHDIQTSWGQPVNGHINKLVARRDLRGRHWRDMFLTLQSMARPIEGDVPREGISRVSFNRDRKNRVTGLFPNGELDWHSDHQSHTDSQRMIGLMSLWGSKGSQTRFLCTAPALEALNSEDRTMVEELVSVWAWDGGEMCRGLEPASMQVTRYSMVPADGMETPLLDSTATGRRGVHFPSHCFSHFKGMSAGESQKYKAHLWAKLNRPEYIYSHDWEDGEIVFMDQNITLHARPTDVVESDTRTMTRMITYMDKLFPGHGPRDTFLHNGKRIDLSQLAALADAQRRSQFEMGEV